MWFIGCHTTQFIKKTSLRAQIVFLKLSFFNKINELKMTFKLNLLWWMFTDPVKHKVCGCHGSCEK